MRNTPAITEIVNPPTEADGAGELELCLPPGPFFRLSSSERKRLHSIEHTCGGTGGSDASSGHAGAMDLRDGAHRLMKRRRRHGRLERELEPA